MSGVEFPSDRQIEDHVAAEARAAKDAELATVAVQSGRIDIAASYIMMAANTISSNPDMAASFARLAATGSMQPSAPAPDREIA